MDKLPIQLRVERADLARWQAAAKVCGLSLSEWMRRVLNGAPGVSSDQLERLSTPATKASAIRPGTPRKAIQRAALAA